MLADHELTDAERRLLDCAATGLALILGPVEDAARDPAEFMNWPADRVLRARFLVELLTGRRRLPTGDLRAVIVQGARIDGRLDLAATNLVCPAAAFVGCAFVEEVDLRSARLTSFALTDGYVPSLPADRLHTDSS